MKKRTAKIMTPVEWLQATWCSDRELLYRNKSNDLEIYDVATDARRLALSFSDLARFLTSKNLALSSPQFLSIMTEWNGRDYEIYLNGNWRSLEEDERWLIKITRPDFKPQLVSRDFPFRRTGHFDISATKYVYSGETETHDSNAVYVRDIASGQEHLLVEGDPEKKYFSVPKFYGDRIIFVKDAAIWMMNGDGSNQEQLFPQSR